MSTATNIAHKSAPSQGSDVYASFSYKGKSYTVPTGLFIGGKYVPAVSGKKFPSVNPATGDAYIEFHEADGVDVDRAVDAAYAALPKWLRVAPSTRGQLITKLADLFQRDIQTLSELESIDNGKPVHLALADIAGAVANLKYMAGWADKIHGKVVDVDPDVNAVVRHEPIGVVGQIIPWNVPLLMLAWKLGPALAAGNCIVMKTSEKTPLTGLYITQLITEAGFPPGVINILSGFGPTAGHAIASHMRIGKVAFTGSTATGRRVMETAAKSNLKKVSLELGGKSANIVFPDADLDKAAFWSAIAIFGNQGQACSAGSRLFVHEDIYDKFMEKMAKAAQGFTVGDPFDRSSKQGAIVDEIQFNRILSYIDAGRRAGAKVITGGSRVGNRGYFVAPTIFTEARDDMQIVKEEIFGPVVVALKFKTLDEVVKRANDTEYGLAAAVHTTNLQTAIRVSNALQAGTVFVNTYHRNGAQVPFGGYKQSGIGRENGKYGIHEYIQNITTHAIILLAVLVLCIAVNPAKALWYPTLKRPATSPAPVPLSGGSDKSGSGSGELFGEQRGGRTKWDGDGYGDGGGGESWGDDADFEAIQSLTLPDLLPPPSSPEHRSLTLGTEALAALEKRPGCFQRAAEAVRGGCGNLNGGEGGEGEGVGEEEKARYAILLTRCELATASAAPPRECEGSLPIGTGAVGACVGALMRVPQMWSSWSGNNRDVVNMCFAVRYEIERANLITLHKSLTTHQRTLHTLLLRRTRLITSALSSHLSTLTQLSTSTDSILSRTKDIERDAKEARVGVEMVREGVEGVRGGVEEVREGVVEVGGRVREGFERALESIGVIKTDVGKLSEEVSAIVALQREARRVMEELQTSTSEILTTATTHFATLSTSLHYLSDSLTSHATSLLASLGDLSDEQTRHANEVREHHESVEGSLRRVSGAVKSVADAIGPIGEVLMGIYADMATVGAFVGALVSGIAVAVVSLVGVEWLAPIRGVAFLVIPLFTSGISYISARHHAFQLRFEGGFALNLLLTLVYCHLASRSACKSRVMALRRDTDVTRALKMVEPVYDRLEDIWEAVEELKRASGNGGGGSGSERGDERDDVMEKRRGVGPASSMIRVRPPPTFNMALRMGSVSGTGERRRGL